MISDVHILNPDASAVNALACDRHLAERFIALLDADAETFTFQLFDDDRTRKDPKRARVIHGEFEQVCGELERPTLDKGEPVPLENADEVRSALEAIDPDTDYDSWLKVGQALHSTGSGSEAFDLFNEWSKRSKVYDHRELEYKWHTFGADGGITLRTLFGFARENGWKPPAATAYIGKDHVLLTPLPISETEWHTSSLTPMCIVAGYLYADVALLQGPGGQSKTTLMLFEAMHIALGVPLYGRDIVTPGRVVVITAEDTRPRLIARLRRIARQAKLTAEQTALIRDQVRILDVTGLDCRLAHTATGGMVVVSGHPATLVEALRPLEPVLVSFDPTVSFGASESKVNDNEQALVHAARRIVGGLGCCVRFTHHTGKVNAREGADDQYAGRGGSALPDGSRMVHTLIPIERGKMSQLLGEPLDEGQDGLKLTCGKLSYVRKPEPIYLVREGHGFKSVATISQSPEMRLQLDSEYVLDLVRQADKPTRNSLEMGRDASRISQHRLRAVLKLLEERGVVTEVSETHKGGAQFYLGVNEECVA